MQLTGATTATRITSINIPSVYRSMAQPNRKTDDAVAAGFSWQRGNASPAVSLLTDAYQLQTTATKLAGEGLFPPSQPEDVTQAAKSFVSAYNTLLDRLGQSGYRSLGSDLRQLLQKSYAARKGKFAQVGITAASDGKLTVNEAKLTQAVRDDSEGVRRLMQSESSLPSTAVGIAQRTTYRVLATYINPGRTNPVTWAYSQLSSMPLTGSADALKGNLLNTAV